MRLIIELRIILRLTYFILCVGLTTPIIAGQPDADKTVFFESKIRPILVQHCYKCHSSETKQAKGGLRLDTRESIRKGGDSGPAVIPGDLEKSLLLQAVIYDGGFYDMPPAGKLSDSQIADLRQWVATGATDPREQNSKPVSALTKPAEGRSHWAFQPVKSFEPPDIRKKSWPLQPLDHFILSRLESKNLKPAPPADKLVWLRRVWFDLVGLPPTTEAIESFSSDNSPLAAARAKVVDELLAQPQFGERWARHWLDVARFAESSGGGRTLLFKDAWRYRDYCIDAFNSDMPYDQFLREQLSGDLLPAETPADRARQLTATGFLVLGPTNYEEQDKYQLRMDIIDEQLDTLGRTTMGMTIGCARCHDHKFDPIPTRDYYAMAGILRSTRTLFNDTDNVARWIDTPLPADGDSLKAIRQHELKLASIQTEIRKLRQALLRIDPKTAQLAQDGPVNPASLPGVVIDDARALAVGGWKTSTYGNRYLGEGSSYDQKNKNKPSTLTFDPDLPKSGLYEVRLAYVAHSNRATNTPITILHAAGEELRRINQKEEPPIEGRFVSLGTYRFEAGGAGFVMVSNENANGSVSVDGVWFFPVDETTAENLGKSTEKPVENAAVLSLRKDLELQEKKLKALQKNAPPKPLVMTVKEHEKIEDSPVHIRGNSKTLGPRVPRGALSLVAAVPQPQISGQTSGRVEMAGWLTDPRHPLVARVMVNRVWLWLFGQGLVRSPDNFGTTGQVPTHPELLDYLANQFVAQNWSFKSLIRSIVLSQTYAMSSEPLPDSEAKDPENLAWTHFRRRRQDADSLRDVLLSASGLLDLRVGGPNIDGATAIDANDNGSGSIEYNYIFKDTRRSVYTPAFRNKRLELFESFDFADINQPVGQREESIVATQALYLMNHPFVREMANKTAKRLIDQRLPDNSKKLDQLSIWIFSRPALAAEKKVLLPDDLRTKTADEELHFWSQVAHAMYASIEFRYIK
ncbi:MAG: DUF1549 domain-containing protein [bacterium]